MVSAAIGMACTEVPEASTGITTASVTSSSSSSASGGGSGGEGGSSGSGGAGGSPASVVARGAFVGGAVTPQSGTARARGSLTWHGKVREGVGNVKVNGWIQ